MNYTIIKENETEVKNEKNKKIERANNFSLNYTKKKEGFNEFIFQRKIELQSVVSKIFDSNWIIQIES